MPFDYTFSLKVQLVGVLPAIQIVCNSFRFINSIGPLSLYVHFDNTTKPLTCRNFRSSHFLFGFLNCFISAGEAISRNFLTCRFTIFCIKIQTNNIVFSKPFVPQSFRFYSCPLQFSWESR